MWIERKSKKKLFINNLLNLKDQVLLVRGSRQVGKTSFILNALKDLSATPQIHLNFLYPSSFTVGGVPYRGRDFFGTSPTGENFIQNLERELAPQKSQQPFLIFIDEVDHYPLAMESIQTLAGFSGQFKFILTGSNLENIVVKNAATGRKNYFDLYPITFREFLENHADDKLLNYFYECSPGKKNVSDYYDLQLQKNLDVYIRLGGLPKILSAYFDQQSDAIPHLMKDLAVSIEENVKTILGEKSKLYEYEDVLRKLAFHSMNTLKLVTLQVNHAGRQEAKKILSKTVGARVAHKIRLWEDENDLSKYVLFDCGLVNYLLGGADLLGTQLGDREKAILSETFVACELIAHMITRDDLLYWKSGNRAELEFLLRAPKMTGIDVKVKKGNHKSLHSFALLEPKAACLVKIGELELGFDAQHVAKLSNYEGETKISFLSLPTPLTSRLLEFLSLLQGQMGDYRP